MINSPCIDSGTNIIDVTGDYDGNIRPNGLGYDIGAYEYYGPDLAISANPTEGLGTFGG